MMAAQLGRTQIIIDKANLDSHRHIEEGVMEAFLRIRENMIIPEAQRILSYYVADATKMPEYTKLMIFP